MSQEKNDVLRKNFKASAETERLLSELDSEHRRMQRLIRERDLQKSTYITDSEQLFRTCLKIVNNQVRQDIRIAQMEAQIAELLNETRIIPLENKKALSPPPPPAPK